MYEILISSKKKPLNGCKFKGLMINALRKSFSLKTDTDNPSELQMFP
jgi:hypothetical protein